MRPVHRARLSDESDEDASPGTKQRFVIFRGARQRRLSGSLFEGRSSRSERQTSFPPPFGRSSCGFVPHEERSNSDVSGSAMVSHVLARIGRRLGRSRSHTRARSATWLLASSRVGRISTAPDHEPASHGPTTARGGSTATDSPSTTSETTAGRSPTAAKATAGRSPTTPQATAGRSPTTPQATAGRSPTAAEATTSGFTPTTQTASGRTPASNEQRATKTKGRSHRNETGGIGE
jgi:hypothetical protein